MLLTGLDPQIIKELDEGNIEAKKHIFKRCFLYFVVYYFSEFLTYEFAPMHYEMADDMDKVAKGDKNELAWIYFRESAKTSFAKIFVVYCICMELKKYINYDSFGKENAEAALMDIAVWLQTKPKLIRDFGQLFYEEEGQKRMTRKRIDNFVTANDIKVEAFSTGQSTRGRVYQEHRPDLFILDDFETNITKNSYAKTMSVIAHIDELRSGLGPTAGVLYLGNLITENGSVKYILDKVENNEKGVARNIPVVKDGVIQWPAKYALTNTEADIANKTAEPKVISLENKRASLGNDVFEAEMMNNPPATSDIMFDRKIIEEKLLDAREPDKEIAGFKTWGVYKPDHRYAIGADTAKGVGKDSNASVLIDFSPIPAQVIGTYANNMIAPDVFAHELKRQGEQFGECLLAPEKNNTGYATVTELKRIYPEDKIYRHIKESKVEAKKSPDFGWDTNSATKCEMIYQLKRAVEEGLLVVYDKDLLNEMKYYTQNDLGLMNLEEGMTKHYDKLIACAIAWAMRSYAEVAEEEFVFVDEPTQPMFKDIGV